MDASYYLEIASHALNKRGEELCGDNIEVFRTEDRTIIVLADGLGSGVKANILATLTTKIAGTMLVAGSTIEETLDTVMKTLPVCQVRGIAYSTLGIIDIDKNNTCKIIEYDNPPVFIRRRGKVLDLPGETLTFAGKAVRRTTFTLEPGDTVTLVSDGVIHAGVGFTLNHGWEWPHVATYLERQQMKTAEQLNRRLIDTCRQLYEGVPGDDTSAVTVKLSPVNRLHLFAGPPSDPKEDGPLVKRFMASEGLHVICGGTAANLFARELEREVISHFDYIDPEVPPIATIEGLDLVTEGVLTLSKVVEKLDCYANDQGHLHPQQKDGVSRLIALLLGEATHIHFWLGGAINPAHQNPDFPADLSIKRHVIERLSALLEKLGKVVEATHIA